VTAAGIKRIRGLRGIAAGSFVVGFRRLLFGIKMSAGRIGSRRGRPRILPPKKKN